MPKASASAKSVPYLAAFGDEVAIGIIRQKSGDILLMFRHDIHRCVPLSTGAQLARTTSGLPFSTT